MSQNEDGAKVACPGRSDEFPVLRTERLILRNLEPDDREAIARLYSEESVTAFMMESCIVPDQAGEIVEDYRRCRLDGHGIVWAIERSDAPGLIGTCGFETLSRHDRRGELGYDLVPRFQGRGLMTEALRAVLDFAFTGMDLNRVQALVHAENAPSMALLARLGFAKEGIMRDYRCFRGSFTDWVMFGLTKNAWVDVSGGYARLESASGPGN